MWLFWYAAFCQGFSVFLFSFVYYTCRFREPSNSANFPMLENISNFLYILFVKWISFSRLNPYPITSKVKESKLFLLINCVCRYPNNLKLMFKKNFRRILIYLNFVSCSFFINFPLVGTIGRQTDFFFHNIPKR